MCHQKVMGRVRGRVEAEVRSTDKGNGRNKSRKCEDDRRVRMGVCGSRIGRCRRWGR